MCIKQNHRPPSLRLFGLLILVVACGLNVSCGSSKIGLEMTLNAKEINPNDKGTPSPVQVRIYTLKSRARFDQATFRELWGQEYDYLGNDILEREQQTLFPFSSKSMEMALDPEQKENFLGVVAGYRKPQEGVWRRVIPIEEPWFGGLEYILEFDKYDIAEPIED